MAEQAGRVDLKDPSAGLSFGSNLQRTGSIKDLINKFSGADNVFFFSSQHNPFTKTRRLRKYASIEILDYPSSTSSPSTADIVGQDKSLSPSTSITPPIQDASASKPGSGQGNPKASQISARIDCPVGGGTEKTDSQPGNKIQATDSGRESVADSGMGSVSERGKKKKKT